MTETSFMYDSFKATLLSRCLVHLSRQWVSKWLSSWDLWDLSGLLSGLKIIKWVNLQMEGDCLGKIKRVCFCYNTNSILVGILYIILSDINKNNWGAKKNFNDSRPQGNTGKISRPVANDSHLDTKSKGMESLQNTHTLTTAVEIQKTYAELNCI